MISIEIAMSMKVETGTKLVHSHKDDDVKELLLAEMGREDKTICRRSATCSSSSP
jgi:hypothetical protein